MRRFACVAIAVALASVTFLLLTAPRAWAVPSFTRRYGLSCTNCHTMWGALNGAGVTFRLSGYRAINGRDLEPLQDDIQLGGVLTLPGQFPISVITGVGLDASHQTRQGSDGASSTADGLSFDLEDASIFLSSPLGRHLSFFMEFPMYETLAFEFSPTGPAEANTPLTSRSIQFHAENPVFEVGKFWWNSLIPGAPRDSVNLLFGVTQLPLAYSPGKVRLSVNQYLVYERRGLDLISPQVVNAKLADQADSLFRLSEPQILVELNGMLVPSGITELGKRQTFWLEYHIGAANGSNSRPDNNTQKDLYVRVVGRWSGQSLGFFSYWSPETYSDNLRSIASQPIPIMSGQPLSNSTVRAGPDLTVSLVPFGIPVWLENQLLYNEDTNPTGFNRAFVWWGGFDQLNWQPMRTLVAYGRFDWIRGHSFDDGHNPVVEPHEWDVVAGLQFLVLENFKLIGEYRHREFEDVASAPVHAQLTEDDYTMRTSIGF